MSHEYENLTREFRDLEVNRYKQVSHDKYLYNDKCYGEYKFKDKDGNIKSLVLPYILQDGDNNIYNSILEDVTKYMSKEVNSIKWWKCKECGDDGSMPSKHILSSQVACLNHLFPLRNDPDAVLAIAQAVDSEFTEVYLLENDKDGSLGYISFEVTSDKDYLNEGPTRRGELCTSIDALILGLKDGKKTMLVFEWKYTESYDDKDYSKEDRPGEPEGSMGRGLERLKRYSNLISDSNEIKCCAANNLQGSIFFFEPFYQLMRQTLWAEQMILHKEVETLKADDYIHVHVIPSANHDLLDKIYPVSGKNMEETWREQIAHQDKYKIIRPDELLSGVGRDRYEDYFDYLDNRYWKGDEHEDSTNI